ncbi:MAG: ROK family protein [Propioniciclava sp.]
MTPTPPGSITSTTSTERPETDAVRRVGPGPRHAVGVDVGQSNTTIIVADLGGRPVIARQSPTSTATEPTMVADWLADTLASVAGPAWAATSVVGISVPGAVRVGGTAITETPTMPQLADPAFLTTLESRLGRELLLDSDTNFAMSGELRYGAARGRSSSVLLLLGASLGVGFARGGHVLRSLTGTIGNFGHLPIGPDEVRLDQLVTGPGLARRAAATGVSLNHPAELFDDAGAETQAELRRQFHEALQVVLTAVTVACDPECIVLGGPLGSRINAASTRYRDRLLADLNCAPTVTISQLGDLAAAVGAVSAALQATCRTLGSGDQWIADQSAASQLDASRLRAALHAGELLAS